MTKQRNLKIISAGAGSGKTYRLTQEMVKLLREGARASGIIATTFTAKAAAELQERVRTKLLEEGLTQQADELSNALIGTVHGLGVKLLKRFAFEAGVSPAVDIIADEDQQILFNQSLAMVLHYERVEVMEQLCDRLGLNKKAPYDWRKDVKNVTEIARANAFKKEQIEVSKNRSVETFEGYLSPESKLSVEEYKQRLSFQLDTTINQLENNEDETKRTRDAIGILKDMRRNLKLKGELYWWELVKIVKLKVGVKSQDDIAALKELAQQHEQLKEFRADVRAYIELIFDMASEAIEEFDRYKKQRGLIDYTDMEVYIKELLDHPEVQKVLAEELDLLMVDEFQDTSPIQLELFLKLSKLANFSVWVGDPKQSIYGFRGAEPELMQAVITQNGGVKSEDIQAYSWRSREDIVFCTNALFTKAFSDLPVEQVALKPIRTKVKSNKFFDGEPIETNEALMHWHFKYEGKGSTSQDWVNNCIADSIKKLIAQKIYICEKESKEWRLAKLGDVAVLCRSNKGCEEMAEALHRAGLSAAIARSGLMNTAEIKLVLACLKYVLTRQDTLSIAEILLLATKRPIEEIIEDRLKYLKAKEEGNVTGAWASDQPYIKELDALREEVKELSSSEILNLLLDEVDLRRIVASWGNKQQRFDNIDALRKMASDYEDRCNRLHTAASLGGFLLWLNEIEYEKNDKQASGESSESVNVLTYHKSKGLEYPILICHSLEQNLRADVWGMEIMSDRTEVDLDDVLGGRWLRFWVNPYADQVRNTPLETSLHQSTIYNNLYQKALAEEARLLYVGITRARDYLIFASRQKDTKWLNRVWHEGKENLPTLNPDSLESPWEWNDQFLPIRSEVFYFDKDFPECELVVSSVPFIEPSAGKKEYPRYRIDLMTEDWTTICGTKTGQTLQYDTGFKLSEEADTAAISKAFKAYLVADWLTQYPEHERLRLAEAHLDRFEVEDDIEAHHFLRLSTAFHRGLLNDFQPKQHYRKYPLKFHYNHRLFDKMLDFVLINDRKIVLVQNSGFSGGEKRWRRHITDNLGSWSYLAKTGLQEIFPNKKVEVWIHFVLSGGMVEVRTKQVTKQ